MSCIYFEAGQVGQTRIKDEASLGSLHEIELHYFYSTSIPYKI
ncbi:MAG: hypothetical protein ACRETQ_02075 [Gammaproteobacteria bacterium]